MAARLPLLAVWIFSTLSAPSFRKLLLKRRKGANILAGLYPHPPLSHNTAFLFLSERYRKPCRKKEEKTYNMKTDLNMAQTDTRTTKVIHLTGHHENKHKLYNRRPNN
jgi:hypothetical protein